MTARLLSTGPLGTLVAVDARMSHEVRAVDAGGRATWRWASPTPVAGAVSVGRREVYVAQRAVWGEDQGRPGLLHRLRVGPMPAPPRTARVSMATPETVTRPCFPGTCTTGRRDGIWLRLDLPRAGRVVFTKRRRPSTDTVTARLPAGRHVVRMDPGCTPDPLRVRVIGPRMHVDRRVPLRGVGLGSVCRAPR